MQSGPRHPAFLTLGAALTAALATTAPAQMHHVDAPERVTRAIGVYEWTGDLAKPTAARFVPVSLFIDGHFEDAGLYLARPVPFALQTGYVYSLEHAGEPEGLFDLDFARRVVTGKAMADDNPEGAWYGFGKVIPEKTPAPPHLHASSRLTPIQSGTGPNSPAGTKPTADSDSTDSRPHMTRRDNSGASSGTTASDSGSKPNPETTKSSSGGQTGSDTSSSTSTTASTSSDDDTDRPTLRRRDPSQDANRRREYGAKSKTSSVTAVGPAPGDDPDRPILGHNTAGDANTPELTGLPADLHQAVAVSDAAHTDDHPFARAWDSPAERAETLAALATLAKARLTAYLAVNALVPSRVPLAAVATTTAPAPATASTPSTSTDTEAPAPPKLQRGVPQAYQPSPAPPTGAPPAASPTSPKPAAAHRTAHSGSSRTAPHAAPLTLAREEISGFTLSYGGLPTFVYTAAVSIAPAKPSTPNAGPATAFVTVVAQRLPSGTLQTSLAAVTDSTHLDRSPQLRLIDAVDPDDSHRASLLFELRGSASRQFALYRLTAAQAEETFTTASIE